jgi:hypothetical protein
MVWLLTALSIYAIIFVAGRAHSRYLDRLEARLNMVVEIQLLIVSPEMIKQIEPLTLAENHEIVVDSLSRIVARNQVLAGASTPGRLTVEASVTKFVQFPDTDQPRGTISFRNNRRSISNCSDKISV